MKHSILLVSVIFILGVSPVFSAGGGQAAGGSGKPTLSPPGLTGDDLAFSKFTKPVDVHIGHAVNPLDSTLPRGDTAGSNQYTRYYLDKYNINIIVDWTAASGEDYSQKVSLCIASDSLPDALVAPNYNYVLKAAKAGQLYDVTDLYEQYASNQVKGMLDSFKGKAIETASYEGRMIALPNASVMGDGITIMCIQKNWLDQYNLPVPKTLDDIENVARVFKRNAPAGAATVPIAGPDKNGRPYRTFIDSLGNDKTFDPVFNAYDVYPGYFIDNGNKTVSYGSLNPNMKPALERLARWYKDGLIDPEMGSRDRTGELVNANQAGIFFGPWWAIGYGNGDSFKNNPNANWQAYPVYDDNGKWNVSQKAPSTTALMISRRASPDTAAAVVITYNAEGPMEGVIDKTVSDAWIPLRTVLAPADELEVTYNVLHKILKNEAKPADYNDTTSPYKLLWKDVQIVKPIIPRYQPNRNLNIGDFDQNVNFGDFQRIFSIMVGARPFSDIKPDKEVYSVNYVLTDVLEQRWPNLYKMEQETIMKIIIGQLPVSAFDKFVSDWMAQGGQGVLDSVANEYLR
ncbi:MAG: extracellular solute-binding protein [Treponema sp.]|jgi:multiple sugar transport system substrate-binding protein/putative aldouronate transport system substrate-binding protein|nr:extracellular solute-binding protein [Treponema sp.]